MREIFKDLYLKPAGYDQKLSINYLKEFIVCDITNYFAPIKLIFRLFSSAFTYLLRNK